MNQFLRNQLMNAMARFNIFPGRMTDRVKLRTLLENLHPIAASSALVRLGPDSDGGYLVPDDLAEIVACFSPGVSSVSGFEHDCASRGMNVFLADRSVDGPAQDHDLFSFSKKFVGATSDEDFMTLDDWVTGSLPDQLSDLLLQMDIEGYEYETILSTSESLMSRFRIIVAEFHDLQYLWCEPFFAVASRTFAKILRTHACVHIHPNNCCGSVEIGQISIPRTMEFTFQRRDRIMSTTFQRSFPHALDVDNTDNPSLHLPACWHRSA